MNSRPRMRMKPASTTSRGSWESISRMSAWSNRARAGKSRWLMAIAGMPAARARSGAGADLGRQAAVAHGLDDRLHVAAAPRNQNYDAGAGFAHKGQVLERTRSA